MKQRFAILFISALIGIVGIGIDAYAQAFTVPGVVPPSACRVGAVLSTEQFTSTGFSNVRTANPNDEIVAGAWVVANNFVPDTSIVVGPNCTLAAPGVAVDGQGINLVATRLKPTISSAAEADITEIKLIWDVNVNGMWDPLLDLVLQTQPGSKLDDQNGAVFMYGPQSPIAFLANTAGTVPPAGGPPRCTIGDADVAPALGLGPTGGTNTRAGNDGCYIALLAVVVVGDNPETGSQFGLELTAMAGDIPGTTGVSNFTFSSGFSSSRNPQASNVRLTMVGGNSNSYTPLEHISNGSGGPESNLGVLSLTGGQQGEGLLSRFRALEIVPGTREVIAMAVGLCDGGALANTNASILPPIAGAPPTIAGGIASLPCIPSGGTDGFATGINGATLIFRGPLARYMSTVRMYADQCSITGGPGAGNAGVCDAVGTPGAVLAAPITATDSGGGDGFLFQAGELVEQAVPQFNEQTNEAIVQFGGRQEQILFTGTGNPVAHGSDPAGLAGGALGGAAVAPGTTPLILIWTVDIDSKATGGLVDVVLGLQSFDDTAINGASGGGNPCVVFAASAPAVPAVPGAPAAGSCASNFLNIGPELYSFSIEAPESPSTPNNMSAFDTNDSCFLDDPEFFASIDQWVDSQIGDNLFFQLVDAWVSQMNVCEAAAASAASVSSLSLNRVALDQGYRSTNFSVTGQGIVQTGVEIFGLNGQSIFSGQSNGNSLNWNHMTSSGAPVANGTYLYVVTVEGANGETVSSSVEKLVIVR